MGGVWITGRAKTQEECEYLKGCQEPPLPVGDFLAGILTPKTEADCLICGGTLRPVFRWTRGTWVEPAPSWKSLTWVQRRYAPLYQVGDFFDVLQLARDVNAAISSLYAGFIEQTNACLFSKSWPLYDQIACDCIDKDPDCYDESPTFVSGFLRMCSQTTGSLTGDGFSITVPSSAQLIPRCVDISGRVILHTLLPSPPRLISSLFLESLSLDSLEIVNSAGVAIGQLAGNGIEITISGQALGNFRVCLTIDTTIKFSSSFTVLDFAVGGISKALRPLSVPVERDAETVCANVSAATGISYFPIFRLREWSGARILDGYSKAQRITFYIALASYQLLWLLSLYRLVHFWLYFVLIHKNPRRARVQQAFTLTMLGWILALLFISYFVRTLYFLLVALDAISSLPSLFATFLIEAPLYLFISVFSLLVAWWYVCEPAFLNPQG